MGARKKKAGRTMKNRRNCWVCGAGDFTERLLTPQPGDLVVAADGGLTHLKKLHILPQHILGDFDSLGYAPEGENVALYPAEKDDTDMLLAVKYGLQNGYNNFLLYGGLGGRLSHSLANIQVLRYLCTQGCHGFLVDGSSVITVIENERVEISDAAQGILSVFALGGNAEGVTIRELRYTVENGRLTSDYPLGVSNEFTGNGAFIEAKNGVLLLVWEDGASDFRRIRFSPL